MDTPEPLKTFVVQSRIPEALKRRTSLAIELYGVTEAGLVRDALEAILDYIDRNKGYRRPVVMVQGELLQAVVDHGASYGMDKAKPTLPAVSAAEGELARKKLKNSRQK